MTGINGIKLNNSTVYLLAMVASWLSVLLVFLFYIPPEESPVRIVGVDGRRGNGRLGNGRRGNGRRGSVQIRLLMKEDKLLA
jgi:hypothetical protein